MKDFFRQVATDISLLAVGLILPLAAIIFAFTAMDASKAGFVVACILIMVATLAKVWFKLPRIPLAIGFALALAAILYVGFTAKDVGNAARIGFWIILIVAILPWVWLRMRGSREA